MFSPVYPMESLQGVKPHYHSVEKEGLPTQDMKVVFLMRGSTLLSGTWKAETRSFLCGLCPLWVRCVCYAFDASRVTHWREVPFSIGEMPPRVQE